MPASSDSPTMTSASAAGQKNARLLPTIKGKGGASASLLEAAWVTSVIE